MKYWKREPGLLWVYYLYQKSVIAILYSLPVTHKHKFELTSNYFCLHDLPMDTYIKIVSSTFVFSQLLVAYMSAAGDTLIILMLQGSHLVQYF